MTIVARKKKVKRLPKSTKIRFTTKDGAFLKGETYDLRLQEAGKFVRHGVAEYIEEYVAEEPVAEETAEAYG